MQKQLEKEKKRELILEKKLARKAKQDELKETDIILSLIKNISKPVLRSVIKKSINILAKQFIFEKDIKRASKLSSKLEDSIYAYSFDMLGEGARTYKDANKYFENYKNAIKAIGKTFTKKKELVLDPFMGGGTSLIEAIRLNRKIVGIDLNPIAYFATKVKITKLSKAQINKIELWAFLISQNFLQHKHVANFLDETNL